MFGHVCLVHSCTQYSACIEDALQNVSYRYWRWETEKAVASQDIKIPVNRIHVRLCFGIIQNVPWFSDDHMHILVYY